MYKFEVVRGNDGSVADVVASAGGRRIPMAGAGGKERELQFVRPFLAQQGKLPVFLGTGLGVGLKYLLARWDGPIAILDKDPEIRAATGLLQNLPAEALARITLISSTNPDDAGTALHKWQQQQGGKPLYPIPFSFYQRVDPSWYGAMRKSILGQADSRQTFKRTFGASPRLLLLTHKYFLMGEIAGACEKLGYAHRLLVLNEKETDREQFNHTMLREISDFRPDFCLTLNHTGVDMEGALMHLLEKLRLPLASWFVDNPDLIIHLYTHKGSPWITVFTWDEDNLPSLKKSGFEHSYYLPLGTDPDRFKPHAGKPNPAWKARVSFVGNSMVYKVGARLRSGRFPRSLLKDFAHLSRLYAESEDRSVARFMARHSPEEYHIFSSLPSREAQLAYETAITWKATQIYRNERVKELLPFSPLIVGDKGWHIVFRHCHPQPRLLPPINYYDQLPVFYGESEINFNCTSRQMKGAVNQRIFDAPAAGGFVLTDWRPQMEALFRPDEMACYHTREEIPALVRYYLAHPEQRRKIALKARERVLGCHTWADRIKDLADKMREIYSGS